MGRFHRHYYSRVRTCRRVSIPTISREGELNGAQAGEFCAKSAIVSGVHVAQCRLPPIVGANVIQRSPRVLEVKRNSERTTNTWEVAWRTRRNRGRWRRGARSGFVRPSSPVSSARASGTESKERALQVERKRDDSEEATAKRGERKGKGKKAKGKRQKERKAKKESKTLFLREGNSNCRELTLRF